VLAQAFLPAMKKQRFGRIVNMSSRVILGKKGRTVYGGTKAALVGMTRTWALELGAHGITVNAVAPGPIVTELFKRSNTPAQAQKLVASTAVGRGGTPEDVAHATAFFLSPASGFVTGQVLHVCGGASIGGAAW
jgi:3-oxoacyl-[acyl-carrier protein] reductase